MESSTSTLWCLLVWKVKIDIIICRNNKTAVFEFLLKIFFPISKIRRERCFVFLFCVTFTKKRKLTHFTLNHSTDWWLCKSHRILKVKQSFDASQKCGVEFQSCFRLASQLSTQTQDIGIRLDILFRQITMFIKVCVVFVFRLHTL